MPFENTVDMEQTERLNVRDSSRWRRIAQQWGGGGVTSRDEETGSENPTPKPATSRGPYKKRETPL